LRILPKQLFCYLAVRLENRGPTPRLCPRLSEFPVIPFAVIARRADDAAAEIDLAPLGLPEAFVRGKAVKNRDDLVALAAEGADRRPFLFDRGVGSYSMRSRHLRLLSPDVDCLDSRVAPSSSLAHRADSHTGRVHVILGTEARLSPRGVIQGVDNDVPAGGAG